MTKQYACNLCKNVFNKKIDLIKHQNKIPHCTTIDNMQDLIQMNEQKIEHKTKLYTLSTLFNYCLDLLRINEHLTGNKALKTITYLIVLKLLEQYFGNQIDIDNYEYNLNSYFEEDVIESNKERLLYIVRFSNLSNEKEENIPNLMKKAWDMILSVHPITKNIFLKGKGFHIQHQSTYKKLIDKINTFDFEAIDNDILGEAYEEVISTTMTGKVDGQFFTISSLKDYCIYLINPQLKIDGTIETIFDPAMGTGGFLISALRHLQKQSKSNNIPINWEFITNEGLGGREAVAETHQLAVSNMLIASGYTGYNLEKDDSIRNPIINKYDIILTNPPYGIDGLIYDEILHPLRNKYMPIKSNSAVPLFLQLIINMLKINGRCAVILPNGQELSNKGKALVSVREYLMKTCDLKEIYLLPSGIFTYTSIRTCIFYFIKKREGSDILETKIKKKEREYIFSNIHQTTNVIFYDLKLDGNNPTILVDVPIEKIANNSYSLNYNEYIESDEQQYEECVVVKTLGEVCSFLSKSKRNAKYGNIEGLYPFFKSSMKITSYVNEPDYEQESLIIGDGGEANINYGIKFSTSDHCYILQNKNDIFLKLKYVYYYLYHNLDMMEQLYIGVAIKNISKTNIENIKIPIPSLEHQQEIVKYLDFIYEKANKTSNEKIVELKMLNEFCLNNQKNFGENVVKKLSDITIYKSGKRLPQGHLLQNNKTLYPYIRITDIHNNSISLNNIKYILQETKDIINKYIITTNDIYITIAGTTGLVGIIPDELNGANLTENAVRINIINKSEILQKYLVYDIHYNQQKELKTKTIGAAIPKLSIERLMTLQIPIPSLERQQEIVEYCEYNDTLIKQLEKEIENNKKLAHQFITDIVKLQVNASSENQDDINSVNTEDINAIQEEISSDEEEKKDDIIEEPKQKPKNKKMPKKKRFVIVEEN